MRDKIYNLLTKDVKEYNLKHIFLASFAFLFLVGIISYKAINHTSYALFTDEVEGTKTITLHYEDAGTAFSENVLKVLKTKASTIPDGVYYFDDDGNLDYGDGTVIQLGLKSGKPQGVVSIWNKTPIYVCTNYGDKNYEYTQNTKQINTRTLPCLTDRYQNLVINGDLSFGDNTNLTDFGTYNSEGYLSITTNGSSWNPIIDYIPIDPNKKYEISIDMKNSDSNAKYYAGLMEYDVEKNIIMSDNVMYQSNTLTELAQNLNPGDKVIHFADLTNWNVNTSTRYYQRGFIFWNYKDSTEYEYPELTYSKNRYFSNNPALYEDSAVNKTDNTITLTSNSGWTGPAIPKGTKVSQSSQGAGYNYSVLSYSNISTSWHTYNSPVITSVNTSSSVTSLKFRAGTKYIRFFIDFNNTGISNLTTYVKNISIKEVKE